MADRTEALVLQMSADITRLQKSLDQARGTANRQLGAIEGRFDKLNAHAKRSGDQMASDFRRSIAALGIGVAVSQLSGYADTWTNLRNQVRQYGDVVGPVGAATDKLVRIANDAGVQVAALGETFAASARAAKGLGASSAQVFAFNEAVAKGSAIANTGSAALEGALRQLGQAIGSPKVELNEFNSVIEGTPRLAQAFADGIGKAEGSVAKLRALIASGKVSGGDLFQGLLSQLGKLQDEFAASEKTISQSVNRLGNAATRFVGEANRATGAGQALSAAIDFVASNFDTLADAAIVAASVMGTTLAAGAMIRLVKSFKDVIAGAGTAKTALEAFTRVGGFLSSGAGVGVLGIAAALGTLAFQALSTKDPIEDLKASMEKFGDAQANIESDTAKLTRAQEALTKAIKEQSKEVQDGARIEIATIKDRIAANKELAIGYELDVRNKLATVQKQLADYETDYAKALRGTPDFYQNYAIPGIEPNADPADVANLPRAILAEVKDFQENPNTAGFPLPSGLQQALDLTTKLVDKRREVQELTNDVSDLMNLRGIGRSGSTGDLGAVTTIKEMAGYYTAAEKYERELISIRKDAAAGIEGGSRAMVKAMMDYVDAGGAMNKVLEDARQEWGGILRDYDLHVITDYVNAVNEARDKIDFSPVADPLDPMSLLPDSPYTVRVSQLEEQMRDAVKRAMKDGITTGDWDDAFRSILAEAITNGLDKSLNQVADWLSNYLFADDGLLSNILNGASAFIAGRPTGGSVGAYGTYRVNDRADQGEFLFMGSNPGQVLRASDMNRMMGGRSPQGVTIHAPIYVEGSIDAVTWPKVQQAMQSQARTIMSAVPGAVNATLVNNRLQKRRL